MKYWNAYVNRMEDQVVKGAKDYRPLDGKRGKEDLQ